MKSEGKRMFPVRNKIFASARVGRAATFRESASPNRKLEAENTPDPDKKS